MRWYHWRVVPQSNFENAYFFTFSDGQCSYHFIDSRWRLTRAKGRSPHVAIRFLNRFLTDKNASRKMIEVLLPRFANRPSGRLRIAPLGRRVGDGASMVTVSFISSDAPKKK